MLAAMAVVMLVIMTLAAEGAVYAETEVRGKRGEREEKEMRGIWVATVLNLDYPRTPTADAEALRREALEIIEDIHAMGFQAVYLQVRPTGDAFYPSKLVPWSKYLTGARGVSPDGGFDPLRFWVEECHKRGIELHAWLNPYRLNMGDEPVQGYDAAWLLEHSDGKTYLNPGVPAVREHLLAVVGELVSGYDIDGIHFDDYFYPGKEVSDDAAYLKYNPQKLSRTEWRRENVNALVRNVHQLCAKRGKRFGVSPFGIWANKKSSSFGSATQGFESLISQYADTRTWVKQGWLDYICPQIYWPMGYSIADYEVLAHWWADVVRDTDVELYIGLASYKAMDPDPDSPWFGAQELLRQINLNRFLPEIDGEIHFRYRSYADRPELRRFIQNLYQGRSAGNSNRKLIVGRPQENVAVQSEFFFIGGSSDPAYPLYINGELIQDRTASGLFGRYVPLAPGDNVFSLSCGNQTAVRVVTRTSGGGGVSAYPIGEITRVFPTVGKAYRPGELFELSCTAPAGCTVQAELGGVLYTLEQQGAVEPGYPAVYKKAISLQPIGSPRVLWLGMATYRCYRGGVLISEKTADKPIEIIMNGAALYARVKGEFADLYLDNSREIGGFHIIPPTSCDLVTGEDGDLYRLDSGLWVKTSAVDLVWEDLPYNRVHTLLHTENQFADTITITAAYTPVAYADLEGRELRVRYHGLDIRDADVANIRSEMIEGARLQDGHLVLTLRDPSALAGYYTDSNRAGEISLVLKKKKVTDGDLQGVVIMIDPGHGGSDTGGISLYGPNYSESSIVLDLSFRLKSKLEKLGATVLLTRADDTFVSLYDRLCLSRKYLPDLFLSMHTDSLYETSDLSRIRGASAFYKYPLSRPLAERIAQTIYDDSELNSRGAHEYNFYVCRGTWAPSLLLENGFACSPFDLEFIMDFARSETLLNGYVDDILDYFKK